jgi:aldose 1-epimerase
VDAGLIPTGELRPVKGTPFDFTTPHTVGERIGNTNDEQIARGNGYDHNWVLNKMKPNELSLAARVTEPASGRVMEVWSTEPATQFYTGNFLDGSVYQFRNGFCFEPQHYPDSPNHPDFPTTELKAGEIYKNTIIYKFSNE